MLTLTPIFLSGLANFSKPLFKSVGLVVRVKTLDKKINVTILNITTSN